MDFIQKISRYFLMLFNVLLVGLPVFELTSWIYTNLLQYKFIIMDGKVLDLTLVSWDTFSKIIGCSGGFIGLIPVLLGLYILKKLFTQYYQGAIFTQPNVRSYMQLGTLFFIDAFIMHPLSETLIILASTLTKPVGERLLVIGFGSPNLQSIFCGTLIIVISKVMSEGYKLEEDKKLII